mmetsp:Transcript_33433/g.66292  ORF Transcript_33433/g.66292 Transcript_33433/m.66292 type:complete len:481 (+) Transcript_33433:251-1693(+)
MIICPFRNFLRVLPRSTRTLPPVSSSTKTRKMSHKLQAMARSGVYNKFGSRQAGVHALVAADMEAAAERVAAVARQSVTIADLGCSEGRNSMPTLNAVLRRLDAAFKARQGQSTSASPPVSVFFCDLPGNDWTELFRTAEGQPNQLSSTGSGSTKEGGLEETCGGTFAYACGKSFYERLFAPKSLDLAISMIALHWLPSVPSLLPGLLVVSSQAEAQKGGAADAWEEAGKEELLKFLHLRAPEMKKGGELLIVMVASNDDGGSTCFWDAGEVLVRRQGEGKEGESDSGVVTARFTEGDGVPAISKWKYNSFVSESLRRLVEEDGLLTEETACSLHVNYHLRKPSEVPAVLCLPEVKSAFEVVAMRPLLCSYGSLEDDGLAETISNFFFAIHGPTLESSLVENGMAEGEEGAGRIMSAWRKQSIGVLREQVEAAKLAVKKGGLKLTGERGGSCKEMEPIRGQSLADTFLGGNYLFVHLRKT